MNIHLNIDNGELTIGDVKISPTFSITDIEDLQNRYEIIFNRTTNTGYTTYRSSSLNDGDNSILFTFRQNQIFGLNISNGLKYANPPYVITEEKRIRTKELLKLLGGEYDYLWGKVYYNEDPKGGNVNVGLRYNN